MYDGLDKSVDCDVNKNNNIFEKHILIVKNKTMSSKTVKFNKKKHMRSTNKMYFCFNIFSNLLLFDIYKI